MKHKSNFRAPSLPKESCADLSKGSKFHPLSYYLNGGIDLTGRALDKDAEVEYDNEEQLKELEAEGAMSVPYGDPRMSKFRLVEDYGKHTAKKASAKSAKPTQVVTESTESTD